MAATLHVCMIVLAFTEDDTSFAMAGTGATQDDALEDAFCSMHSCDKADAIELCAANNSTIPDLRKTLEAAFYSPLDTKDALNTIRICPGTVLSIYYNTLD